MRTQPGQPGAQSQPGQQGRAGDNGRGGSSGAGGTGSELQRLRDEYQRELQRAQDALGRLSSSGANGATPEQQEFSRSAPGTEAFKQDRSGWDSLRKDIDLALEKHEAAVSDRLSRKRSADRFSAGGSDRVPEGLSPIRREVLRVAREGEEIALCIRRGPGRRPILGI